MSKIFLKGRSAAYAFTTVSRAELYALGADNFFSLSSIDEIDIFEQLWERRVLFSQKLISSTQFQKSLVCDTRCSLPFVTSRGLVTPSLHHLRRDVWHPDCAVCFHTQAFTPTHLHQSAHSNCQEALHCEWSPFTWGQCVASTFCSCSLFNTGTISFDQDVTLEIMPYIIVPKFVNPHIIRRFAVCAHVFAPR